MIENEKLSANTISGLARSYNPLYTKQQLQYLLRSTAKNAKIKYSEQRSPHKIINDILISQYKGESTFKALLAERFINSNVTAAFEIRVNNSRADFLTVNGDSKSYEIKSELDNLSKLVKQVSDYERVFDFNYIVIDKRHYTKAIQMIPPRYGVLLLETGILVEKRRGQRNNGHDLWRQLELFSKKEFFDTFNIPGISKEEVCFNFTDAEINERFKEMLKKRYAKRWNFLVSNAKSINPIDYQFFFRHNLSPEIIYGF